MPKTRRPTKSRTSRTAPRRRHKQAPTAPQTVPLLNRDDLRTILFDLATRLAPADVDSLMEREDTLRRQAADLTSDDLSLLREEVALALDCLRDHVAGDCSQIPYYTIALLAAGMYYFADQLDVIPDFLPGIGRLDDAAVMAMACELAKDGLQRYCDANSRPLPRFHLHPVI